MANTSNLMQIYEPGQTPLPHEGEAGLAVGIDLGTTNSVIALSHIVNGADKVEVFTDEDGEALLPSVVAYDPYEWQGNDRGAQKKEILVGRKALREMTRAPEQVVSSIKRFMGRGAEDLKSLGDVLPYHITSNAGEVMRLRIGARELTPMEISAEILKALKQRAEKALARRIDQAVITVPAYFDDAARSATKDAARFAGLSVLRLLNEPTAAALAYGLDQGTEGLYAVYDLGGGTFDLSILKMEGGVFQVLATAGDTALGGDDFDHLLAEHFLAKSSQDLNAESAKQLLLTCRHVKEHLTNHETAHIDFGREGSSFSYEMTRDEFEKLITPLVEKTIQIARHALLDAGLAAGDLEGIILVGGSTRVPLVRQKLKEVFDCPIHDELDPDQVVAMGAARQAANLTGGSDHLLLDILPLSLGLETMGGLSEKIIPRNSPIPTAKAQDFTTHQDNQTGMKFHIVQGERELAADNRSLAHFELTGIPPMPAGTARVRVIFEVDADGILTVSAQEEITGTFTRIEVVPSYGLSEEDMTQMLMDSLLNAESDMEKRLLLAARFQAEQLLRAVREAVEKDSNLLTPEEDELISDLWGQLEQNLTKDDRALIHDLTESLEKATKEFAERRLSRDLTNDLKGKHIDKLLDESASS